MSALEPRRVQQALVCMLFDPEFAAKLRAGGELPAELRGAVPELSPRERELLRGLDPRALGTDAMRRARALHVLLDEYPVSAAVLGVDFVDRFFGSAAFRACVFERGSMSHDFGRVYLRERAKGVGLLETAMVCARRADPRAPAPSEAPDALQRAPGVEALSVPEGSLAYYQRGRARLGAQPLEALAKLRKPWKQAPPRRGREHLLIETAADGSLQLSGASAPLVGLLRAAQPGHTRRSLLELAVELGAGDPREAGELLDELLADGLLAAPTSR